MFEKNYYCLVAGLREYALDSDTKGFNAREIIAEILEEVSSGDAEAVRLLYGYYDCENIIALRAGRSAYNPLGNIPAEELEQEMTSPQALPKAMASSRFKALPVSAMGAFIAFCHVLSKIWFWLHMRRLLTRSSMR